MISLECSDWFLCNLRYADSGPWSWGALSFDSLGTVTNGFSAENGVRETDLINDFYDLVLCWTPLLFVPFLLHLSLSLSLSLSFAYRKLEPRNAVRLDSCQAIPSSSTTVHMLKMT